jgi:hypothetical protein
MVRREAQAPLGADWLCRYKIEMSGYKWGDTLNPERFHARPNGKPRPTRGGAMKAVKNVYFWIVISFITMAAFNVHAEIVVYTLDNVILDDNNTPMYGTFSWTYNAGDFENGVGVFTFLDIPFTIHDHTDLDATFDIGNSIEITLAGSVHDDGVDITLFLLQPLTPTTSASVDLTRSQYEIGGNGFHTGLFLSGSVSPTIAVPLPPAAWMSLILFCGLVGTLIIRRTQLAV